MCPPPFERHDDDDDEWEDVSSGEEEHASGNEKEDIGKDKQKHRCDGGSSCLCKKPAADHPEYPWIITVAGFQKCFAQHIQISLRDPDNFEMYTFNDHAVCSRWCRICFSTLSRQRATGRSSGPCAKGRSWYFYMMPFHPFKCMQGSSLCHQKCLLRYQ
jgi:hypothetical protein